MSQHPFALYNPALLPPDVLLEEFTARRPLLDTLLGIIRGNAPGPPPQHCLLIGTRGMGKTTLLWVIAHSVTRDMNLGRQWQPVVFDEESRRVGDLADFWLEAIRQWEYVTEDRSDRAGQLLKAASADIEEKAQRTFLELVTRSGKRALLLIDNINDLLGSIHDPEPLHRLRAFLMKESSVMLIGGATRYFEEVTSVDQPFYDFFRNFELRPLSLEEMKACLLTLAKTRGDAAVEKTLQEREGTIRALHILTGGNPRLIKTFYRLLRDGLQTDIRADLEKLLDEFTPYFKAIVDALPVQQQRILDAVALAWDPVEVGRLATTTRLPSNQVSAQLRALMKAGLISEAAGHPKRKTYLLTDRFSNIHYLMRHGRAARNRFDWFVALVRLMFPDEQAAEILVRVARESAAFGADGENDARCVMHSAWQRSETQESRRLLTHAVFKESWEAESLSSLHQWFDTKAAKEDVPESDVLAFCAQMPTVLREQVGYKPQDAEWWYDLTDFLERKEAWRHVELAYRKSIDLNPNVAAPWYGLADVLAVRLYRYSEAEAAYRKGIALDPTRSWVWNNLATVLQDHLGRPHEAEQAYREAINLDPVNATPWNGLGNSLQTLLRFAEAEQAYRKAIELNPNDPYPWNGLGPVLVGLNRPIEAERACRKSVDLDPEDAWPWHNLGNILQVLHRYVEAEEAYRKAIQLEPADGYSWNSLGNVLKKLHRPKEAEEAYHKAIGLDPKDAVPWNGLGNLLMKYDSRVAEAEGAYRKAIELDSGYSHPWNGLGNVLAQNHRPLEAEEAFRKAIELDSEFAYPWSGLADTLEEQKKNFAEAQACAMCGLVLEPSYGFARRIFLRLCGDQPTAWERVLPPIMEWLVTHREESSVFDFVVEGFLRLARLTSAAAALKLFDVISDASPFETVQDALVAVTNRDHLHRLAPERQAVVLEMIKRLEPEKAEGPNTRRKRKGN